MTCALGLVSLQPSVKYYTTKKASLSSVNIAQSKWRPMDLCQITAIDLAGMSVAAVLLYTAPAWVAVICAIFLSEPLTKRKTLAVVLAMIGCALVARVYDLHELQLNWLGIPAGLGAGC